MKNKTILVTGGLGYIGSHTVVELYKNGYDVVIIDNLYNSDINVEKKLSKIIGQDIHFYTGDVTNSENNNLDYIFKKYKINTVIHFAAHKSAAESTKNPIKYYDNNVCGLINLIKKMEKYNVKNIIFSSSATVYGQPDKYPVTELTELKEHSNPYGKTKKICEDIIIDLCNSNKINAVILRYFNPIGCHSSGLLSDMPKGKPENLVPNIVDAIKGNIEKMKIYGNNYNTHDGTAVRDYINVNDLAESHVLSLNIIDNGYKIFNIGSGKGFSVLDIINSFKSHGISVPYQFEKRRPGDIEKIYADTTKAQKELKWKPKTSLNVTIQSIINHLKK